MSDAVEPWVEPYLTDFATIRQILARTPGFLLQPIETPSPDLARALAQWLAQQGVQNTVVELTAPTDWERLPQALVQPAVEVRPTTLVIATKLPSEVEARRSLSLLNIARDSLAVTAGHILWCGETEFQQLTRRHAPDLWSVAGSPYSIPLRRFHDVPWNWPGSLHWWTGAVDHDPAELEHRLEQYTADTNESQRATNGLKLVEALLTRKDAIGAHAKLCEIEPLIRQSAPLLLPRWYELSIATMSAVNPESIDELRRALENARERGAERLEAALHIKLALLLDVVQPEVAFDEAVRAREILNHLGDRGQVRELDTQLVFNYSLMLTPELEKAIARDAAAAKDSGTSEDSAHAELVLAQLALRADRLRDAEQHAARAFEISNGTSVAALQVPARLIQATAVKLRGEPDRALELAREALVLAEQAERLFLELQTRALIAEILEERGNFIDAATEILVGLTITKRLDDYTISGTLFLRLAHVALLAGAREVSTALSHFGVSLILPHWQYLATLIEQADKLREFLTALPEVGSRVERLLETCRSLPDAERGAYLQQEEDDLRRAAGRLVDELNVHGVKLFAPETWSSSPARA